MRHSLGVVEIKTDNASGIVVWFTGLSGAGKSTLARAVEKRLREQDVNVVVLDGDSFRKGVSKDLGFSDDDRSENNRRAAEVARLLMESGMITLAAFVSPFHADRARARDIVGLKTLWKSLWIARSWNARNGIRKGFMPAPEAARSRTLRGSLRVSNRRKPRTCICTRIGFRSTRPWRKFWNCSALIFFVSRFKLFTLLEIL